MTSIASAAVDTFSLSKSLADLSNIAARPTFELQFSILQNSLLDRLSKKIEAFNDDSLVNNVDAFLVLEKKRLERIIPNINKYEQETTRNYVIANGLVDDLNSLSTLAAGGDATAFDTLLSQINSDLQKVKTVSGLAIGMNVKDRLTDLQSSGLGIGDFASYGDATTRQEAIAAALAKIQVSLSVLTVNLDGARSFESKVDTKITSVAVQIEATLTADKAAKLDQINKLIEENANLLKVLSIAFEVNAAQSEAFSAALFSSSTTAQGTVADLINPNLTQGSVLNLLA